MAVDARGEWFGAADIRAESLRLEESAGRPALAFELRPERQVEFARWLERRAGQAIGVAVRGVLAAVAAPAGGGSGDRDVAARALLKGPLSGPFSRAELEALAAEIRAGAATASAAPPLPGTTTIVAVPDGSAAIPSGNDPADIRAIQGAQQMLAAEKRLRDMIANGKITGVDRILSFEEIASWPYEDGLIGLPKPVQQLDGKKVLMTGFMLPIDQVEDIKEFLLVQSLWSCCYGQPPDINGIVRVVMQGEARIDYQFEPIRVTGTFRVKETKEDGYCVDIFQLEADSVAVIE